MAILQCNKCANLFHDDAPHECRVERWQRLANEAQQAYERAINSATKPATTQPPEWRVPPAALEGMVWHDTSTGKVLERIGGEWKAKPTKMDRALDDFTARRKAKREGAPQKPLPQAYRRVNGRWKKTTYAEIAEMSDAPSPLARAMQQPAPHDPDIRTRLMPWKGKDDE